MSRIINSSPIGTQRTRLTKSVVITIRQLMQQPDPDESSQDYASFIYYALVAIGETVETTVTAWEKRGYWVKADRFRLEWAWTQSYADDIKLNLISQNWFEIAQTCINIAEKLKTVKVSKNHRLGKPWTGAWKQFQKEFLLES